MKAGRASTAVKGLRRGESWTSGRRRGLLEAAAAAVASLGPAVSMDDIAEQAGVSRVVLYRYFGDKGGLYQALAERYVGALMERLRAALAEPQDPRGRLEATIDAYVSFVEENHEAYDFLMHRAVREGPATQATIADFIRGVAREVAEELAREMAQAGIDPAPAKAWAHGIVGMVHLAADWWLDEQDLSRHELVAHLVDLLWRGFSGLASAGPEERRAASSS